MHMQMQETVANVASATAATATATAAGQTGKRFFLVSASFQFSGVASVSPPVRATITDGISTLGFGVGTNGLIFQPANPIPFVAGQTVSAALPSGGVGAVGDVVITGYYAD